MSMIASRFAVPGPCCCGWGEGAEAWLLNFPTLDSLASCVFFAFLDLTTRSALLDFRFFFSFWALEILVISSPDLRPPALQILWLLLADLPVSLSFWTSISMCSASFTALTSSPPGLLS